MTKNRIALKVLVETAYVQYALFPVLVSVLTAIAWLFGGACAAWQWWAAVLLVMPIGFLTLKTWKMRLASFAMLGLFLLLLWSVSSVLWISCLGEDMPEYHYPAIRLMTEGWNPVWQSTFGQIADFVKTLGLTEGMFRMPHVAFMPKTLWGFCATANKFTKDPYCLFAPLIVAVLPVALARIWMSLSRFVWPVRCFALALVLVFLPGPYHCIDLIVSVSGVALVMTMLVAIKDDEWDWMSLFVFSFWMCVAKQTSCLSCFVFWLFFTAWNVCTRARRTRVVKIFSLGTILFGLFCVTNVSPYLTSAIHYGHPLYPVYTGDAIRYPANKEIGGDFLCRNEDAAQIGHVGMFVSSYVSAKLAHAYYKLKLGVKEFEPRCFVWDIEGGSGSQTNIKYRLLIVFSLMIVLALGDGRLKMFALVVYGALGLVPAETVGYLRYVPWWSVMLIFALMAIMEWRGVFHKLKPFALFLGVLFFSLIYRKTFWSSIKHFSGEVERSFCARKILRESPPSVVYVYYPSCWADDFAKNGVRSGFSNRFDDNEANLMLLVREAEELRDCQVRTLPQKDYKQSDLDAGFCKFLGDPVFRVDSRYKIRAK